MKKLVFVSAAFAITLSGYAQSNSTTNIHVPNGNLNNTNQTDTNPNGTINPNGTNQNGNNNMNNNVNPNMQNNNSLRDSSGMHYGLRNNMQDTMHTAKPVQPKSTVKTDKDKMYLVPDSKIKKDN
jgi:hypothetical protein